MYVGVGALAPETDAALKEFAAKSSCWTSEMQRCVTDEAAKSSPACAKYRFINDAYKTDEGATDAIVEAIPLCDYSKRDVLVYGGAAIVGAALLGFILGTQI